MNTPPVRSRHPFCNAAAGPDASVLTRAGLINADDDDNALPPEFDTTHDSPSRLTAQKPFPIKRLRYAFGSGHFRGH